VICDSISFLREAFPTKFPGIKTIPMTETEIKKYIHSLEAKNSLGYDQITCKIIKVCTHYSHLQSLTIYRDLP
jgi:hypothetical protein